MNCHPIIVAAIIAGGGSPAMAAPCSQIPPAVSWMTRPVTLPHATSFVYRKINGTELRLHVFSPTSGRAPYAAVVWFFGGSWSWGTVEQFVPQSRYLAERGMVAVVVDYRVLCRDQSTPADSVDDAREAIRWIRGHARSLGIDPDRIAAGGESAGAQLAVSPTFLAEPGKISSKPNALVLYSPPFDLTDEVNRRGVLDRFGDTVTDDQLFELSPLQHLAPLPPMLVMMGHDDDLWRTAEVYCRRAGKSCEWVGYPGGHGFAYEAGFPTKDSPAGPFYQQSLEQTVNFFIRLGYLTR